MEDSDPADRRPMIVLGKTIKGYWPAAKTARSPARAIRSSAIASHPYGFKMNSEYIVTLARDVRGTLRRDVLRHARRRR